MTVARTAAIYLESFAEGMNQRYRALCHQKTVTSKARFNFGVRARAGLAKASAVFHLKVST
jgi:hypothetical protein